MHRHFIVPMVIAIVLTSLGTAIPLTHATDIKIDYPESPIQLGRTVTYSLINTPPGRGILSCTWAYKFQFENCEDTWRPFGTPNNPTAQAYETMPGTQVVRCDIVWGSPSGGSGTLTQRAELTVTVAPPDTAAIASGDNVTTYLNSYCETRYNVKSRGSGFNLFGLAQEFVYDAVQYTQHLDPTAPNSTLNRWIPVSSDAPDYEKFHIDGNQIRDMKRFSASTSLEILLWESMKEPDVQFPHSFYTAKQKLRLLIEDPCGNPIAFELTPTFNISMLKNGANTYIIRHSQ